MFHKKHYYRVAAYISMMDFNGRNSVPVRIDKEFFSELDCHEFVSRNNLNAEWPGYEIPATTGVCVPECFCQIYRRQIRRYARKGQFYRVITLLWFGFERMRRSVAEQDFSNTEKPIMSKHDVPSGYHWAALKGFIKSWRDVADR